MEHSQIKLCHSHSFDTDIAQKFSLVAAIIYNHIQIMNPEGGHVPLGLVNRI